MSGFALYTYFKDRDFRFMDHFDARMTEEPIDLTGDDDDGFKEEQVPIVDPGSKFVLGIDPGTTDQQWLGMA